MMRAILRGLKANTSGVAMTEFALGAPFLLMAGLWGAEEANFALVNMKVSQLALHIADNASRVGDTSTLQNRKIYEADINDVLYGAQIQAGSRMGLYTNGRVIVSSYEWDDVSGTKTPAKYIHWQRCRGAKAVNSTYGNSGDFLPNGIGPTGVEVSPEMTANDAVIFVEINYTYQPLISAKFIPNRDISAIASFAVRDKRDLTQIYQRDPLKPDPVQTCTAAKKGDFTITSMGVLN